MIAIYAGAKFNDCYLWIQLLNIHIYKICYFYINKFIIGFVRIYYIVFFVCCVKLQSEVK